jgi:predicted RNA-binding protein YlxR (DUF448 family)
MVFMLSGHRGHTGYISCISFRDISSGELLLRLLYDYKRALFFLLDRRAFGRTGYISLASVKKVFI